MTITDKARAIAHNSEAGCYCPPDVLLNQPEDHHEVCSELTDAIAQALREERVAALEEAAKWHDAEKVKRLSDADRHVEFSEKDWDFRYRQADKCLHAAAIHEKSAEDIRALKDKEPNA